MKTKQRLTMLETHYEHTDSILSSILQKLDKHEDKVDSRFRTIERMMYIGFGVLIAVQFAFSNGLIKAD